MQKYLGSADSSERQEAEAVKERAVVAVLVKAKGARRAGVGRERSEKACRAKSVL
jgi:hypothetical protein